jgi:hypothetical protein
VPDGGLGMGDPLLNPRGNAANDLGLLAGFEGDEAMAQAMAMELNFARSVRSSGGNSASSPRRMVRKPTKPARKQSSTAAARRKSR